MILYYILRKIEKDKIYQYQSIRRSQWPRRLRHELSSLARKLGSWFRIPLNALTFVCVCSVFVLSYAGSGLVTGWSPVQGFLPTVVVLRNWSETKHFTDVLCSKVGTTGKRERKRELPVHTVNDHLLIWLFITRDMLRISQMESAFKWDRVFFFKMNLRFSSSFKCLSEIRTKFMLRPTVTRPVCLCIKPIWGLRPDFCYCQTVADLLMSGPHSDERMGLSFKIADGPRQRSHSRFRVPRVSRPYFTASYSRLPNLEGQVPIFISHRYRLARLYPQALGSFYVVSMTRRATVEIFESA
jgi:hypothetical protein